LIDPEAFGGLVAFTRETSRLAAICRSAPVAPGRPPVRLPGDASLARRRLQLRDGVTLYKTTMPALASWAERLGVPVPVAMASSDA
jgi:LDH2 family malate/lactate/ureidoglycolate dehydrogenase